VPADDLPLRVEIKRYLKQRYPEGLFSHQHAAVAKILGGTNVVITTPTSSGKSLIFTVPAFQAFLEDGHATSLFIYPQKALANDQLLKLKEACAAICSDRPEEWLIARYCVGSAGIGQQLSSAKRIDRWLDFDIISSCMVSVKCCI